MRFLGEALVIVEEYKLAQSPGLIPELKASCQKACIGEWVLIVLVHKKRCAGKQSGESVCTCALPCKYMECIGEHINMQVKGLGWLQRCKA